MSEFDKKFLIALKSIGFLFLIFIIIFLVRGVM